MHEARGDETKPTDPATSGKKSDDPAPAGDSKPATEPPANKVNKAKAALTALRTQQQIPTIRGGSLGIPSMQAAQDLDGSGTLQAMVSGTVANSNSDSTEIPKKLDFDFFTRVGGIHPFRNVKFDIVAERYKQDMPRTDLSVRPVLPKMTLLEVRSIGVRAIVFKQRDFKLIRTTYLAATADAANANEAAQSATSEAFQGESQYALSAGFRFLQRSGAGSDDLDFAGAAGEAIGQYSRSLASDVDESCKQTLTNDVAEKEQTAQAAVNAATDEKKRLTTDAEQTLKMQSLDKAVPVDEKKLVAELTAKAADVQQKLEKAQADLKAAQADTKFLDEKGKDTACTSSAYRLSLFAGISGTMLHSDRRTSETMAVVEDPLFKELRFTAGVEVQTNFMNGTTLLPRFGLYGTWSRSNWTNKYAAMTAEPDIHAVQWETGFYMSGHLVGGFDALISAVALKSYGNGPVAWVLNVAPAIGAPLGGN